MWVGVFVLIATNRWSSTYLRRTMVTFSLVAVLGAIVLGGLVSVGVFPANVAHLAYTAVATAVLIVGIVLLSYAQDTP
jgi:hypothetical protein